MNIFKTRRAYVGTFGVYLLGLLVTIRAFVGHLHMDGGQVRHPSLMNIVTALVCVIVLVTLFRRTDNVLERAAVVLTSLYFLWWALELLSGYGYVWMSFGSSLTVSSIIFALATILVGVRTAQVMLRRSPTQDA